jgi:hypothetical protein
LGYLRDLGLGWLWSTRVEACGRLLGGVGKRALLLLVRPALNRAEVVRRSPPSMVNEVALAESLLEVLRRLRVETTVLLLLLAIAGAGGFSWKTPSFIAVSVTHHQIVGINFASLCRLHQLVGFLCSMRRGDRSVRAELMFEVIKRALALSGLLLSQDCLNRRCLSVVG